MLIHQLDGIIFDLDGTLVDSSLDFTLIRQQVGCPLGLDMLQFIETMVDPQQREQAHAIVNEHEMRDAYQSKWLPGAEQLIQRLTQLGIPQAIVTRNSAAASQVKISNNQIPISTVISRESHRPKPAPDALLDIAERWSIAPSRLMYVGDFLYDVQAGNNAGMISCLITNGRAGDYHHLADHVFGSLEEFMLGLFG